MVANVWREEVMTLTRQRRAQVVDVLPQSEFQEEHVTGAINIPLKKLDQESLSVLDPSLPVIVYCHDSV